MKERFVKVIRENMGIINSLCRAYYCSAHDREDARQDIILQLWNSFPKFREESQVSTWIYRVSLNTIFSDLRKSNRRPKSQPIEDHWLVDHASPIAFDDDHQFLQHLIGSLKPIDKALLILHLEGYQHNEIATMLNIRYSTVTTRLNRARSGLKKIYEHKTREI